MPSLNLPVHSSSSETKYPGEATAQKQNYKVLHIPPGFQTLAAITDSPCLSHQTTCLLISSIHSPRGLGPAFCSLQSP